MSREAKILNVPMQTAQRTIQHYESFGWELLTINGTQIAMTRETQNPIYDELVKYQAQYEALMVAYMCLTEPKEPESPPAYSFGVCVILLLLGIVPGILYIQRFKEQSKAYDAAVDLYKKQCEEVKRKKINLWSKMEAIVAESRNVFFTRQIETIASSEEITSKK